MTGTALCWAGQCGLFEQRVMTWHLAKDASAAHNRDKAPDRDVRGETRPVDFDIRR